MPITALLDADIIAFTESAIAKRDDPFGDGEYMNADAVISRACIEVEKWRTAAGADDTMLVFSPEDRRNFRKHLAPGEYKAHRAVEKPPCYWPVVAGLKSRFPWFSIAGVEGDDAMGVLHTSQEFGDTVAVSTDKDLYTVPGPLFNPVKQQFPVEVGVNQATWHWWFQVLCGDTSDGYKGCPGIGPVKAERLLPEPDESLDHRKFILDCWEVAAAQFAVKGLSEDHAVLQARLARILHRTDYHHEREEICLWHPDSPQWLDLHEF